MPKGHIGNATVGGRRLSWPDWVRASAEDADTTASGTVVGADIVSDTLDASANATSDIPQSFNLSIAQGIDANAEGEGDTPLISTFHTAVSDEAISDADIPLTETIHNAESGVAEADSDASVPKVRVRTDVIEGLADGDASVSDQRVVTDAGDSNAEATAGIPLVATVHNATDSDADATGSKSIVTWQARLAGVVKLPSGAADGAEVHVIRDNDDTKVATTTTDSNGEWSVTVRGGKTTEDDPPVYSIEVWHREGDKRDPNATIYNATNRPFIDTADPSETNPYDTFYYKTDG